MSVLNENQLMGASGAGGEYEIEQSLRFNDDDGSYLERTPAANGNQKTWTWSGWVKRGNLGGAMCLFSAAEAAWATYFSFYYDADNTFSFDCKFDGTRVIRKTASVFRDTSAWYHVTLVMDTTNATNTERVKVYINGEDVGFTVADTGTYPAINEDTGVNKINAAHGVGKRVVDNDRYLDGYLAEVNLIDGQALTPDSFGETGDYGEWKPIAYAGTYGTNGFYLPFEQDYTVEGFSTVVYEGNGATQYIGGTGFSPSLVWAKQRNAINPHEIADIVRGVNETINSNGTGAGYTNTTYQYNSFDTDGFTVTDDTAGNYAINGNGQSYVAWNWDMGGTTASNTNGSITSSVRANTAYGQSIVSWTGNATAGATVGHGLASAPTMIIVKRRTAVNSWITYHGSLGATKMSLLDQTTATSTTSAPWNNTEPTSSVFTIDGIGPYTPVNNSGDTYIAYCFSDVTGYSKFGSYSGTGASGNAITTGFSPAFVMTKRTDAASNWIIWDNTRNPSNTADKHLLANSSSAEATATNPAIDFTSTGFELAGNDSSFNASGGTYVYMAFADTREYAYWLDQSGNNNDWTSEGGLTESDVMVDSPTNNFATLNPLDNGGNTLSEGNLALNVSSGFKLTRSTFFADSGKWYWEILCTDAGNGFVGVSTAAESLTSRGSETSSSVNIATSDGDSRTGAATSSYGSSFADGDIMILALDMDNGKFYAGKNGTWFNSGNPATSANPAKTGLSTALSPSISLYDNEDYNANFGADSSFAGNKTPQGNQDSNGIGDFYYQPPSGFLSLCTKSLPSVDVIPSEHFNTVTWTGNGSARSITTGVDTDLVWTKARNQTYDHNLFDSVRGALKKLSSNSTSAESSMANSVTAFNTDGFTLGDTAQVNLNGGTFVAWNWKAGGNAVSNTNGSITSSVSANVDAGFSIVSYTGTGSAATVGHGLASTPTMIIVKNRSVTNPWWVYTATSGAGKQLRLNGTNAEGSDGGVIWNNTAPTSSVFSVNTNTGSNGSGNSLIAYCFHSVDGYSRTGKYIGNGLEDGPFVHLGFSAKFIMIKELLVGSGNGEWQIFDTARSPINVANDLIAASTSGAESVNNTYQQLDILSNGFKLRSPSLASQINMATTYVYLAFAENPFKHSNAR